MRDIALLLDFINIETWNRETLRDFLRRNGVHSTIAGEKQGFDSFIQFDGIDSFYPLDLTILDSKSPIIPPDRIMSNEVCFSTLSTLQDKWRSILLSSRDNGLDIPFLNEIVKDVNCFDVEETDDPLRPQVGKFWYQHKTIERSLAFAFLSAAIRGETVILRKLRTCECGKLFFYNRSKQKFCNDACRHKFHNQKKIESGYLAEHQKKKRKEGNESYWR